METIRLRGVLATSVARSTDRSRARTPSETKDLARQLNREEREDRQRRDREHQERLRAAEEMARRSTRSRGPRIDVNAVYAARSSPARDIVEKDPAPRGPRSFGELAAAYYGPSEADALIAAGRRGGR